MGVCNNKLFLFYAACEKGLAAIEDELEVKQSIDQHCDDMQDDFRKLSVAGSRKKQRD